MIRWASPHDSLSKELPKLLRLWPAHHGRQTGIFEDKNPRALTMWGQRKDQRRNREHKRINEGGESRNIQGNKKKKTVLTLFYECYQSIFQRVGHQQRYYLHWPVLVTFYPLPFTLVPSTLILVLYLPLSVCLFVGPATEYWDSLDLADEVLINCELTNFMSILFYCFNGFIVVWISSVELYSWGLSEQPLYSTREA